MAQYGRSPGPAALQKAPMQRSGNMPRTGNLQFEGYRDPNMRNADPFSNYRGLKTTQDRKVQQDYGKAGARKVLPFRGGGYLDVSNDFDVKLHPSGRSTPGSQCGEYADDRIRNSLLDEICSDFGVRDTFELDLFEIDNQFLSYPPMTRLPADVEEFDQTIPFGRIDQVAENYNAQLEMKQQASAMNRSAHPRFVDKNRNPSKMYTSIGPLHPAAKELNDGVASPTISSSCEPEKIGVHPQSALPGNSSDCSNVHSTTNCQVGTNDESKEERIKAEQSSDFQKSDDYKIKNEFGGDRGKFTEGILAESELIPRSPSVQGVTKLEDALPSELVMAKDLCSSMKQKAGDKSAGTSASTSPSQIHVAKKQRVINTASDLLEDLRDAYSCTQGADMYAPAAHPSFGDNFGGSGVYVTSTHPTFGDHQTGNSGHNVSSQPYRFELPQGQGSAQYQDPANQRMNFNFGNTSANFGGTPSNYPQQKHQMGGRLTPGRCAVDANQFQGYPSGRANVGGGYMNNAGQFCGNEMMSNVNSSANSPAAYQSCPDLTSPERLAMENSMAVGLQGNQRGYHTDAAVYGRTPVAPSRMSGARTMGYGGEDVMPYSPNSHMRQQVMSAPSTPSKHHHQQWNGNFQHGMQQPQGNMMSRSPMVSQYSGQGAPSRQLQQQQTPGGYPMPQDQMTPLRGGQYMNRTPRINQMSRQSSYNPSVHSHLPVTPRHGYPFPEEDQHAVPLSQNNHFMQQIFRNDSPAFKEHPLFPLLRDIIIADMNTHSPSFPFQLIAHLPTDFGRLLSNYLNRNPGISIDQGDPAIHPVFMDALKFAHSTLISKIEARKMKEGYQDQMLPSHNVEEICESFQKSINHGMNDYAHGMTTTPGQHLAPTQGQQMSMNPGYGYVPGIQNQMPDPDMMPPPDFIPPYPIDYSCRVPPQELSSSVPYGLNLPQHLLMEERRAQSLPPSPRKVIRNYCTPGKEGLGDGMEKTGKNKVLPKEAVNAMIEWLREHQDNPYPNDDEKEALINTTKLSINQINYWFTNARRRILPKWALARHLDEQEKARQASASSYAGSGTNSPSTKVEY